MLTETEFNALGEKLKTVTHNRSGKKVLRAYLSMDYAFYCAAVAKNKGAEPSDVIYADYFHPVTVRISLTNDPKTVAYYPSGQIHDDITDLNDLVL